MDSHDQVQPVNALSNTIMELHADAYGKDESDELLRNTHVRSSLMGKSTLTPITKEHAHQSNKFKLSGATNDIIDGRVKKNRTSSSKKRPAHWRKEALRHIFAGVF